MLALPGRVAADVVGAGVTIIAIDREAYASPAVAMVIDRAGVAIIAARGAGQGDGGTLTSRGFTNRLVARRVPGFELKVTGDDGREVD